MNYVWATFVFSTLGSEGIDLSKAIRQGTEVIVETGRYHGINQGQLILAARDLKSKLEVSAEKYDKVSTETLTSTIKDVIAKRLVFGADGKLNYLPFELGTLLPHQLCNIFYFESLPQNDGWTCGYRSTFNAAAINHLLTHGAALTSRAIKQRVCQYEDFSREPSDWNCTQYLSRQNTSIPNEVENPDAGHLNVLAGNPLYGLNNPLSFHILGYFAEFENGIVPDLTDPFITVNPVLNRLGQLEVKMPFFNALRASFYNQHVNPNVPGALHFVCVLPSVDSQTGKLNVKKSHWVLISIVKLMHKAPIMIILDSINSTIRDDSGIVRFLEFLYNQFM